jgi:hypothetical protein
VAIPEGGFSLVIPAGWTVLDKKTYPGIPGLCCHPHFRGEGCFIDPAFSRRKADTLEEHMRQHLDWVQTIPGVVEFRKLSESTFTAESGVQGYSCVYQVKKKIRNKPAQTLTYSNYYFRNARGRVIRLSVEGEPEIGRGIVDTLELNGRSTISPAD